MTVPLALTKWRDALDLLPATSAQHATISARVADLSRGIDAPRKSGPPPAKNPLKRAWAAIVTGTLVVLSKAKLLLLGLTKLSTLSSMLLFLGVYWSLWGWQFALGFVVCIYIHEMGHVAALARYGIAASPPMFIPGFGALVRLKQSPANVRQDARVGLAGPIWGLAAAVVAYAIGLATGAADLDGDRQDRRLSQPVQPDPRSGSWTAAAGSGRCPGWIGGSPRRRSSAPGR